MLNQIDLSRTDLNLLVLFETVNAERNVGRAAARLSLTPSAVSHGLGRLRQLFGDPLFLRTPKGVVPTDKAASLEAPIAEILARVRNVIAPPARFDPAQSTRRFVIGAPDGVSSIFLPPLIDSLRATAPGVAIGIRQSLPRQGDTSPETAWRDTLADLETRAMDVAVIPANDFPVRFARELMFTEDFVVAARKGHPYFRRKSLDAYCACDHLVVSLSGDPVGFVDIALEKLGRSRRVALTVPNFMFALPMLARSDLIAALPRRFVEQHGPLFGVQAAEPPTTLGNFSLMIVTPKVALEDKAVAWLVEELRRAGLSSRRNRQAP